MEDNKFRFSYSALTKTERQEIEDIRKGYLLPQDRENKLNEIRELDNKVKNIPLGVAILIGIVGTLVFGLGLTCILEWKLYVSGVVISVIGSIVMGLTHYIFVKLKAKLTEKYKDRILVLSDGLLNEYENKESRNQVMEESKDKLNSEENKKSKTEFKEEQLREKRNNKGEEKRASLKKDKLDL